MTESNYEDLKSDVESKLENSFVDKYKQELDKKLNPEKYKELDKSYSRDYKDFKKEQAGRIHLLFESLCNFSYKILKVKIKEKDREKIEPFLRLAHFNVSPESVYSFTYIMCLFSVFVSLIATLIIQEIMLLFIGIIGVMVLLFFIPSYPKTTFIKWRAKAADQLVLAVMYLVIQMERVSNLEIAVEFVAKHTSPPISLDFMKVLWDVESKKYSSIGDSLENYIETWRGWDDDFIEAVHLVQFSLQQKIEEKRKETLNRATKVVLSGTHQHMLHYAHSLQGPMEALHMLGVVLPVMALVMLPLIGAFMGSNVKWYHMFIMYNLFFPVVVYFLGKDMLQKRPAGTSGGDNYSYMREKYSRPYLMIGNKKWHASPILLAVGVFVAIGTPGVIYFIGLLNSYLNGTLPTETLFVTATLIFSLDLIAAAGVATGIYFYYSVHYLIKIKHKIERIEAEFPSGIFQLANRIKEKVPAEVAFYKVAQTIPNSDIGTLFWLIDYNMKEQGSSLEDAIFNERYGALSYYPSGVIKSAMSVLIDAVKKGPQSASKSLFSISNYLTSLKRVNERLNDLLAETTSSMRMQIALFIPLITGLVVGLNMLITRIMRNLGSVLGNLPGGMSGSSSDIDLGSNLLSIFQFENMLPAYISALVVGIYIIQIVCIISYLITGINYGYDRIELKYLIGRNLFIATPFFCIVSGLASVMLTNIVSVMPMFT